MKATDPAAPPAVAASVAASVSEWTHRHRSVAVKGRRARGVSGEPYSERGPQREQRYGAKHSRDRSRRAQRDGFTVYHYNLPTIALADSFR